MQNLNEKLKEWFKRPGILARNWSPALFWYPESDSNPFGKFKIDPWELEVLFATTLGEPSECFDMLNLRPRSGNNQPAMGRADFIAVNVKRHELPLLTRWEDVHD